MKKLFVLSLTLLCFAPTGLRAHGHINAGAHEGALVFYTESSHLLPQANPAIYHMVWRPEGEGFFGYEGWYSFDEIIPNPHPLDYFTFAALSNGDTEPSMGNHAPTGSLIMLEIVSVSGPEGALFGFWDAYHAWYDDSPTAVFPADGSAIHYSFALSESIIGLPAELQDPWGHIHGRGFTADKPGSYAVQFRLHDASGLNLIAPSGIYTFHFHAVPEPRACALLLLAGILIFAFRQETKQPTS